MVEPDHINQRGSLHFRHNNVVRDNKSVVEPDHINKKGFIAFKDFRHTEQAMYSVNFCCLILLFLKLNGKYFEIICKEEFIWCHGAHDNF